MEPNIEERLRNIEIKVNETHRLVTKIRSVQRTANAMKGVYWIFLILLGLGAFYFVQPYLNQLKEVYGFIGGANNSQNINELIKQFSGQDN